MGIGLLALYAALAVVALWLIAELLLQNRAPLHWRGLALAGFLLVVAGMAAKSVPLIGAGAAAFAVGQVFVTLSVKSGYTAGWSLRAADGSLPGPLARVPLLGAATGGVAVAAAVAVPLVGEVGPIEEPEEEVVPEPAAPEEEYGVYETAYQEQPQQPQQYVQYDQQQWQQPQPQPVYGYENYQQPQQPQYQDPYWEQQQQQQQQQYGYEYYQPQQPQPEAWQQQ